MTRLLLLWALCCAPLVSPGSPAARPRISFLLDSSDRGLVHFSQRDVHNTTTLLLSDDGSTLYVGARNAILSLNVSDPGFITLKDKRDWSPSQTDIDSCKNKQKNAQVDCPNFIHVLQPLNSSHLYACGSYAYSPHDALLDTRTFTLTSVSTAKGRCPFNPFERNTAITVDGELFTGTTRDFKGTQPFISRHFSRDGGQAARLETSNDLLNEPTFISSSFDKKEGKLYFFFTEVLKEFRYIKEHKGARLAQVCKDDIGGQRTLQKKWTSFAKSLLLCQSQQQPFAILQDMFTLQPPEGDSSKETLFYGVFTSQWSQGSGPSAVCQFKMEKIRDVFSGPYKTFDPSKQQLSPAVTQRTAQGKCGLWNASDVVLEGVKKSFLSHNSVQAAGGGPLLVSTGPNGVGYSRLVVVTTQAANQREYTVLLLLTDKGFLHKVLLLDGGPHIIEEVQVFKEPQLVKSLLVSSSKGVVYVGWSGGVTVVPLAHCSSYPSCGQCVLAQDPFCSWDPAGQACTKSHTLEAAQDVETGNVMKVCPPLSSTPDPVELQTALNEVLILPCARPSDLATLSWTLAGLPLDQKHFLQRPDGGLSFVVVADTLGNYTCTSQEAGYHEVQAVFAVTPHSSSTVRARTSLGWTRLRAFGPATDPPPVEGDPAQDPTEAPTEDPAQEPAQDPAQDNHDEVQPSQEGGAARPTANCRIQDRSGEDVRGGHWQKSYHTELVVVSLLLALCASVVLLGLVHRWSQRVLPVSPKVLARPGDGTESQGSQGNPENDCILKQEHLAPEVKVMV
ncbi:unnamed protein product [Lota lota]